MHLAFPFRVTRHGFVATTNDDEHIDQLIRQLLMTMPGERVNRPDLGSPLKELAFAPGSNELVTATQFLIQGALQQWLGELIQVNAVQVVANDERLGILIQYTIRRNSQTRVMRFNQ